MYSFFVLLRLYRRQAHLNRRLKMQLTRLLMPSLKWRTLAVFSVATFPNWAIL